MVVLGFIGLLLLLLLIGIPVGFVLLTVGTLGITFVSGWDTMQSILSTTAYRSVNSFTFSTIPLFILMAHFISKSKIADDLFDSIIKWIGHFPGGAGIATVFASAGFGTLSGSSVAATSVMSQVAVPQMIKAKYSESFSAGLVASSTGTLAVMIPPSIPLILYGMQTDNSIGRLLIAGIFPGLLLALLLSLTVLYVGIRQGSKSEKYEWSERWISLKYMWPVILLVLIVLIFIYFGIGTATEAAAFGAFGALIIGIVMRRLNFKLIVDSLIVTTKQSAMIFVIIIGAHVFAYFITLTRVGNDILKAIHASGWSPLAVLIAVILLYIVIGLFMDLIGSMLLTLPLTYPIIIELGYDPIWFGVIVVLLLEIGLVTPPVGINLFITSQHTGISPQKIFVGTIPFIFVLFLTVVILIIFPQIVTFLPSLM